MLWWRENSNLEQRNLTDNALLMLWRRTLPQSDTSTHVPWHGAPLLWGGFPPSYSLDCSLGNLQKSKRRTCHRVEVPKTWNWKELWISEQKSWQHSNTGLQLHGSNGNFPVLNALQMLQIRETIWVSWQILAILAFWRQKSREWPHSKPAWFTHGIPG